MTGSQGKAGDSRYFALLLGRRHARLAESPRLAR